MTKDEAIRVCRDPDRSVQDAKRVLDWAAAEPSSDKTVFLLLLSSNAFAATKRIHSELEEILVKCAKQYPEPLWQCIEEDWELYRNYLAMRVLLRLPDVDARRILALTETRLEPVQWHAIQQWASARKIDLPGEIVDRQRQWERQLDAGGTTENAYTDLEKRRPFWPADKDLAPPAAKPPSPRSRGYGEAETQLTISLNQIVTFVEGHGLNPLTGLQAGLSADRITAQAASLPFALPEEAYELYRWRNGSPQGVVILLPFFWFMPLEEAVKYYQDRSRLPGFRKNWLPIFDWNGDQVICLVCGKTESKTAPVVQYDYEDGDTSKPAKSLTELIRNAV